MKLKRSTTLLALGALVSLLLGSGMIALLTDTVTSEGNNAQSNTFTPPQDVEIAMAGLFNAGVCSGTFSDGPVGAAVDSGTLDLNNNGSTVQGPNWFCVKNTGYSAGKLTFTINNVADTELAACGSSEAAAGDTTCGSGDGGELSPVLWLAMMHAPGWGDDASCGGNSGFSLSYTQSNQVLVSASLPAGASCIVWPRIGHDGLNNSAENKLKASTDRTQFDIEFRLEELA